MLQKTLQLVAALLIFGSISQLKAQDRVPFDQGTKYILADVDVTGKISYNKQTVITFAGLEKGQEITIPGEQISNAIKKLGKLGLFSEIDFYINKIAGDSIYLELNINELPKLGEVKFVGIRKGKTEALIKDTGLTKGKIVNENLITTTRNYIENKYKKDGFYNTKVTISTKLDTVTVANEVKMLIVIDKGKKVKVKNIDIDGNEKFTDAKIRSAMKNTKQKNFFRVWKASKFIKDKYKEDLVSVVDKYKENGYRDARVISDSVSQNKNKKDLDIKIKLEEGRKYYFGDIRFVGNTIYPDEGLRRMLGINRGDVYNGVLLEKRIADKSRPDGDDITNLYQNNGYLFSNINAVEVRTANDTIDFEIRIVEGPLAYFNKISVTGNDKTNDKVIYRELRTKPGQKYSKEELVRTIREIGQLGFFDPEAIKPEFRNVDPGAGTVDIEYQLVEKGSSQIELQGGYGGGGFIGTLGLSFNNFSVRNLFNKEAYKPLPMGDGQKVSLRLQGSSYFQTYSVSFSEPWFGGKKPVQFSTSVAYSKQFAQDRNNGGPDKSQSFNIFSLSAGIAKRLTVPDDYFVLSQSVAFLYYDLNNFNSGLFANFKDGSSRNLSYTIGLSRNNKGVNPIFPTYGSEFSISGKFTLPYSLFNNVDYANLGNQLEYKLRYDESAKVYTQANAAGQIPRQGDYLIFTGKTNSLGYPVYEAAANPYLATADQGKIDQKEYKWLEYYKIKLKADWYTKIYGKLVLRTLTEFGYLGKYTNRQLVPFERFYVGGSGLANYAQDGREIVQLRGYDDNSLSDRDGGSIYNKFSLELRYPITLKSAASIYVLGFLEAGNSYDGFVKKNTTDPYFNVYNPFELKRSAGAGLRIFMPAFGLLGIDFGYGFDPLTGQTKPNGMETHFIIGQQF